MEVERLEIIKLVTVVVPPLNPPPPPQLMHKLPTFKLPSTLKLPAKLDVAPSPVTESVPVMVVVPAVSCEVVVMLFVESIVMSLGIESSAKPLAVPLNDGELIVGEEGKFVMRFVRDIA